MHERDGLVTMKGNPITLLGAGLKVGDKAPVELPELTESKRSLTTGMLLLGRHMVCLSRASGYWRGRCLW